MSSLTEITKADHDWQVQKICTDIDDYELVVEKQKSDWECTQKRESWKWLISYHGSVVASGSVNSPDEAMRLAVANMPNDH
ncbi:MAG: hypothetical protein JKY71_01785 [Alphaproteobacteria bacterium]|nr:hypothetical protein [Alphaproteobacteria bacterium]